MSTKQNTISKAILRHGPEILDHCLLDGLDSYVERVAEEFLDYPLPKIELDTNNWFMPKEYKELDIEGYILGLCITDEQRERVVYEMNMYKERNLLNLLRQMKYIVDTLRNNNIVWGVGRGSSVASYVLYLLKVHRIDSIKYNIDIKEFFKGEENANT